MALQSSVALATITLQAPSASISFSSIPSIYRDLTVVFDGILASGSENLILQYNGDGANNYANVYSFGTGSSVGQGSFNGIGAFGGGLTTSNRSLQIFQIIDANATDKHKGTINRTASNNDATYMWASRWFNLAAINSITVRTSSSGTLGTGTTVSLYGRIA